MTFFPIFLITTQSLRGRPVLSPALRGIEGAGGGQGICRISHSAFRNKEMELPNGAVDQNPLSSHYLCMGVLPAIYFYLTGLSAASILVLISIITMGYVVMIGGQSFPIQLI